MQVRAIGTDPIFPIPPFSTGQVDAAGPGSCGYFIFPATTIFLPTTEEQDRERPDAVSLRL